MLSACSRGNAQACVSIINPAVQIEGRGNGIKTNVVNNVDIAKALARPPECKEASCDGIPCRAC